jgi:uncharacterized protein YdaT
MPWYNGDFPPSYKNQPVKLRGKAVKIANELLGQGVTEGVAIATGLKRARQHFAKTLKEEKVETVNPSSGSTDKIYRDIYGQYQEFQFKKRQYSKALHVFHDHTVEYNRVIDKLPVKEMETWRKEFLQQEREFHDVMGSFDRALETYTSIGVAKRSPFK